MFDAERRRGRRRWRARCRRSRPLRQPVADVVPLRDGAAPGADRRRRLTARFHFFIAFHPPLRQPNLLKYLAGPGDRRRQLPVRHLARGDGRRAEGAARRAPRAHARAMTAAGDEQRRQLTAARARGSRRARTSSMPRRPVLVARAPGRLDVMGGIADYSGSLVLELPLAVATWVAVQAQDAPVLVIESSDAERRAAIAVTIPLEDSSRRAPLPYAEARVRADRAIPSAPGPPTSRARWWCCSTSTATGCGTGSRCWSDRTCRSARASARRRRWRWRAFEALAALAGLRRSTTARSRSPRRRSRTSSSARPAA